MSEGLDPKKGVDFIGVNCIFFCHDGNGKLLMHKRTEQCRDEHGRWDCGGGSMEFGEDFEQTIRRELKEEYRCEPIVFEHVTTKNVLREHQGTKTHWVANLFVVEVDPELVQIGEPHKMAEIGWFDIDDLPEPLHSMMPAHLDEVRNHLKK